MFSNLTSFSGKIWRCPTSTSTPPSHRKKKGAIQLVVEFSLNRTSASEKNFRPIDLRLSNEKSPLAELGSPG